MDLSASLGPLGTAHFEAGCQSAASSGVPTCSPLPPASFRCRFFSSPCFSRVLPTRSLFFRNATFDSNRRASRGVLNSIILANTDDDEVIAFRKGNRRIFSETTWNQKPHQRDRTVFERILSKYQTTSAMPVVVFGDLGKLLQVYFCI